MSRKGHPISLLQLIFLYTRGLFSVITTLFRGKENPGSFVPDLYVCYAKL